MRGDDKSIISVVIEKQNKTKRRIKNVWIISFNYVVDTSYWNLVHGKLSS